jgi:phospholipid N-methyltransferase
MGLALGAAMMDTITYMRSFLKDKDVASITPTSPFGVKTVCSKIDFGRSDLIIEYGPGTGVFTNYLLKNMKKKSRLILIEQNKTFGSILRESIDDPRVVIVHDSAENVLDALNMNANGASRADYILSGIPFLWFSRKLKEKILQNTHKALKDDGKFLVYQTCFQADHHLKNHLDRFFPVVRTKFQIMNIPPLRIYEAIKQNGNSNGSSNGH